MSGTVGRIIPSRLLVLLVGGALLTGLGGLMLREGPGVLPFGCVFYESTGLHCPGCGMTRATRATLSGEFGSAFRYNPIGLVLLPFLAIITVPQVWAWVHDRRPPPFPIGMRSAWVLVALILAFGVLRNLPWPPFTLLAPP